jgi:lysophospholipase L1-like esterase
VSFVAGPRVRSGFALIVCLLLVVGLAFAGLSATGAAAANHRPAPASPGHRARSRGLPTGGTSVSRTHHPAAGASADGNWITSWGASPQAATLGNPLSRRGFRNATLREIVFSSAAGTMVRVRLTNAFGAAPLLVGRASVALAGPGAALVPGTDAQLRFAGATSVRIPAGGDVLSDPAPLDVPPVSRIAVSVYLPGPTGPATFHAQSHGANYAAAGAHVFDPGPNAFAGLLGSWFFLNAVDTYSPPRYAGAVVALGDSITAGVGSTAGADSNWPDDLARRLALQPGPTLSVVDEGIGGNRVLNDSECCGVSAINRFAGDVLDQVGVRDVILLEGVNDLGFSQQHAADTLPHTDVSATQIIAGDEHMIAAAHAAGLRIFGGTILPFQGARYWTPAAELKREAINHWILTSGAFDGVLDFAAVTADPVDPERLNPLYDSGDHLHLNDTGYRVMADSIPLGPLLSGLS